jgi:branched-chain amino acid transport system ATP-binding protein
MLDSLNGRARELLQQVDLQGFADTLTVSLPYGRKRALEIATTLATEPEVMLLDEPTQGMGHEDVARVTALIKRVAAGRTVLMVEHNMNVVSTIADRITVLARGSVLAEGDYATVSANAAVREAYMGTSEGELAGIGH